MKVSRMDHDTETPTVKAIETLSTKRWNESKLKVNDFLAAILARYSLVDPTLPYNQKSPGLNCSNWFLDRAKSYKRFLRISGCFVPVLRRKCRFYFSL